MPSIMRMPMSSVYPTAGMSGSLGLQANPSSPSATSAGGDAPDNQPSLAPPISTLGWIVGGAAFAVLLVILMFAAHKLGGEEAKFGNVKGSIYNVFIISLSAFVGLPLLRVAAIKSGINGLTQWALS